MFHKSSEITLSLVIINLLHKVHATCASGKYPDPLNPFDADGNDICLECPPGYQCNNNLIACNPGQYSEGATNQCIDCGQGKYCPHPTLATPLFCPVGTFTSSFVAISCDPCPAGKFCELQSTSGANFAENCGTGTYSLGMQTGCDKCPAGYKCSSVGLIQPCGRNEYSILGQADCTSCDSDEICADKSNNVKITCPDNFIAVGSESVCVPCPAGQDRQSPQLTCQSCGPDEYSISGSSCSACPDGYVCENKDELPQLCDLGQYINSKTCQDCGNGKYCPFQSTSEKSCGAGTRTNTALDSDTNAYFCVLCEDGYDCSTTTPVKCDVETYNGQYCSHGSVYDCPAGTYLSQSVGNSPKSVKDCLPCPGGKQCQNAKTVTPEDCDQGAYCPTGTVTPSPCPIGTFSDATNLISIHQCKPCTAGNFCDEQGLIAENPCPPGYFCPAGTIDASENPCPAGFVNNAGSLENLSDCIEVLKLCPKGNYCPEGSITQLQCPAGTYNEFEGMGDRIDCTPCPKSYFCEAGMTSNPEDNGATNQCAQGYYCPAGTTTTDQFPCQPGTFSNKIDLFNPGQCEPCTAGFFCDFASTAATEVCPEGYYCPESSSEPTPCPAGFYNPDTEKSVLETDCLDCPLGKYCLEATVTPENCPNGFYCPLNTVSVDQYPCPAGTFNDGLNLEKPEDCNPCPVGNYCEPGTIDPTTATPADQGGQCPSGTYRNTPNAENVNDCDTCPEGKICPGTGDSATSNCALGEYTESGASVCLPCLAGYFCDNVAGTPYSTMKTNKCSKGYFCDTGSQNDQNAVCEAGKYCPEATPEQLLCPPGSFNVDTQKEDVNDCVPCTIGYWCVEGQSTDPTADTVRSNEPEGPAGKAIL